MGIFDRIGTILSANINDMIDHAEDPEKMLNQLIRDMAEQITEARGQVAEMLAQQKLLENEVNESRSNAHEWNSKAEQAVRASKDNLAREALRRKNDYDQQVTLYQQQLETQTATVNRLRSQFEALQNKYDSTVRNRDGLIARHRAAKASQQISGTMQNLGTADYTSDLKRMEERINMETARAQAGAEMADLATDNTDQQFDDLSDKNAIDDQLAALKAKVGSGSGSAGASTTNLHGGSSYDPSK